MTDDLTFVELPPGRYDGTVEKIRYSFKAATHIVITYTLDTPNGEVRHNDDGAATGDTKLQGKRHPSRASQSMEEITDEAGTTPRQGQASTDASRSSYAAGRRAACSPPASDARVTKAVSSIALAPPLINSGASATECQRRPAAMASGGRIESWT